MTDPDITPIDKHTKDEIVITVQNAHFLLNFFWAVGLANKNSLLTEGPMVQNSQGQVERFASTGGWSRRQLRELVGHALPGDRRNCAYVFE